MNQKNNQNQQIFHTTVHGGDEQNIKRLKNIIANEKDDHICGQAEIELWEAQCEYYGDFDEDDKETEKDFLFSKLIFEKEERLFKLEGMYDAAELEIKYLKLQELIDEKIKNQDINKYYSSQDYRKIVEKRLKEIKSEIKYLEIWIESARKEIKNKKYNNIPMDILNSIHMDAEGLSFWEDEKKD